MRLRNISAVGVFVFSTLAGVGGFFYMKHKTMPFSARQELHNAEKAEAVGDFKTAIECYRKAHKFVENICGPNTLNSLFVVEKLATACMENEDFEQAELLYRRAIQILLSLGYPEHNIAVIDFSIKLAKLNTLKQEFSTASVGFQFCTDMIQQHHSENSTVRAMLAEGLGQLQAELGQLHSALSSFKEMEKAVVVAYGEESIWHIVSLIHICHTLLELHDYDACEEYAKMALSYSVAHPDNNSHVPSCLQILSEIVLSRDNNLSQAQVFLDDGLAICAKLADRDGINSLQQSLQRLQNIQAQKSPS